MDRTISRSQKLQQLINQFLYSDKTERLKKGCQIICKYNGLMTLSQDAERHEQSEFYYCYGFDDAVGSPRTSKGNEILEILGKRIEFTDLCLFISKLQEYEWYDCFYSSKGEEFEITFEKISKYKRFSLIWECSKDFHHQNDDFYDNLEEVNLTIL